MEYLIGATVGILSIFILSKIFAKTSDQPVMKIKYRQSHIFEILGIPAMVPPGFYDKKELQSQSIRFFDSRHQKILFFKGRAYWIKDNSIYTANLVNGLVDEKSTKTLDIMAMDRVELNDMIFIVDKLNEGQSRNDSGNPWK